VKVHGTDPLNTDTDGDGRNDKAEVENCLNPLPSTSTSNGSLGRSPGCNASEKGDVHHTVIAVMFSFMPEAAIDSTVVAKKILKR